MSFNGQLNLFFGKIISCTCDLHLKLDILNPLNFFLGRMVKKMSLLPCNLFLQNFKTLKFLYDLVFHQVHLMNMYFHRNGHVFVVQKVWNQLQNVFMHSFKKKCSLNIWYIVSLYDSKWDLHSIQINFKYFY